MADATNTRKRATAAKPASSKAKATGKAAPKPAQIRKPAVSTAEPALLTASEALSAAQAATGEAAAPRRRGRPPKAVAPVTAPAPAPVAAIKTAAIKAPTEIPLDEKPGTPSTDESVAAIPPVEVPPLETLPEPVAAGEPIEVSEQVEDVKPIEMTAPQAIAAPATAHYAAEGTAIMTDVIESTKKFAEDAKAKLESTFADLNLKAKASVEKSTKAMEELSDLAKGNVEAFVESGKIAAKGVEALGQEAAEYSRKNFEKATATFKNFASVKSPTEFFQLQSELLSTAFDSFAKETAKNSEAMLKLAGDVAQPISTRVSIVTEKVKSLAA